MSESTINESTVQSQQELEQQEISPPVLSPGAQLAALRQAKAWSVEQVASQLNLAPRQIQAIETDNYAALPGMVSVRGFIRSYAKLLKVDATPLLATIVRDTPAPAEAIPQRRVLSEPFIDTRLRSKGQNSLPSKMAIAIIALILVIGGVFVGQTMGWLPAFPPSVSSGVDKGLTLLSASAQNSASSSAPALSTATASETGQDTVIRTTEVVSPASVPATDSIVASASASVPPVARPVVVDAHPNVGDGASKSGKDLLILTVRSDSWIEVKRGNSAPVISRLVKAGSTETIEVTGPMSLAVGNVAGVDATLRGAPLNLKSGPNTNVARLSLK